MTKFLAGCRYLLLIPVVGCVLLTAGVVVIGLGRTMYAATQLFRAEDLTAKVSKQMALAVIEIIDLFLVGTVAYITAVGLYKLFISDDEVRLPMRLQINTLKDLEFKIIGVIVAALAVAFLGQAAGSSQPENLLNYGAGIALVIASLALFMRHTDKEKGPDK
jgi:uncharacterized membrane protein YqhA